MGAKFSDVALPFGERKKMPVWTEMRLGIGHLLARREPRCGVGLRNAVLLSLSCSLRAMKAFLWPRMFDALFARVLMSTLLRQILRFLCSHRFSWPHSGI